MAGVEFVRRSPRGQLPSAVMVTSSEPEMFFGDIIDISMSGASLALDNRPRLGAWVWVLIDPEVTTKALPTIRAMVLWSRRDGQRWRVGVTFDKLPDEVRVRLAELVPALGRGTGASPTIH